MEKGQKIISPDFHKDSKKIDFEAPSQKKQTALTLIRVLAQPRDIEDLEMLPIPRHPQIRLALEKEELDAVHSRLIL